MQPVKVGEIDATILSRKSSRQVFIQCQTMKSHGHPSERLAHMRVAAVQCNKVIVPGVRRNPVIGPDQIGSIAFEHLKELTIAELAFSRAMLTRTD